MAFWDKEVLAAFRASAGYASLRHSAGPTSTVGSAEASSFGPRPAQGVFCDVHAAAKYGLEFIRGLRAANSVRPLDAYRGLGDRFIGAACFLLAKLRRIQFP